MLMAFHSSKAMGPGTSGQNNPKKPGTFRQSSTTDSSEHREWTFTAIAMPAGGEPFPNKQP